ncbi:MAG: flagellar hook capping FlgD N-terminal domain-containing protein [Pseudomonadota bacterium]
MEVAPTTNNTATSQITAPEVSEAGSNSSTALASDFETFLNLLTAQLENQDPLQPLESTEFVAQLAQFSSVEQQVATNEALAEMLAKLDGTATAELSQWLGRRVEAQSALAFDGEPIELTIDPNTPADEARLVITDLAGLPLGQVPLDPNARSISWDGSLGSGETAEPGTYRFQVERFSGGTRLPTEVPSGFAEVTEVRLGDGDVQVVLDGEDSVSITEISSVRAGS